MGEPTDATTSEPEGWSAWPVAGLLAFASLLRFGSLGVTQVEWWDSAIYLTEARRIAEGIPWAPVYEKHRAPLLPWIGAASYGVGLDERGVYLVNLVLSVGAVWLLYRVAAILFDRPTGLLAGFFLAVSWESLFFTQRVLTETPAFFLWMLSLLVYVQGVIRGRARWLAFLLPVIVLGALAHFRTAFVAVALGLHAAVSRRWRLVLRREFAVSALLGIGVLVPYVLFSAERWGSAFGILGSYHVGRLRVVGLGRLSVLARYLEYLPRYLGTFLFLLLLVAIVGWIVSVVREKDREVRGNRIRLGVLLGGLVLVPLVAPSLTVKFNHRLGIFCLPGLFLVLAPAAIGISRWIRARSVLVARAFLVAAMTIPAAQQLATADEWLEAEGVYYLSVKEAGLWIRDHSPEGTTVVTTSWPQVNYYGERRTVDVPADFKSFKARVLESRAPYLVLSEYEGQPRWVAAYLEKNRKWIPLVRQFGDIPGMRTRVFDVTRLLRPPPGRAGSAFPQNRRSEGPDR